MGVYSSDSEALMKFNGDKRKREDVDDFQSNKKSKAEFDLKKESSISQSEIKLENPAERMNPVNGVKDIKPSLDLDLGESVDEIVNQRLASLQGDLESNLDKPLADDLLSNLLSRNDCKKSDKSDSRLGVKTEVEMCLDKDGEKEPPKFQNKSDLCEVKGSIDLDLGESVDELVNARLASLADEIVPSLPSRALGDDVLVGLLSDPPASLFSHIGKSNASSTSSVLLADDAHNTAGIFSSSHKDISVSPSRSLLGDSRSASASNIFSLSEKRCSASPLSDARSSSDLFSTLEKRVAPSESLLGDRSSLFSSLDKSFDSPSRHTLITSTRSATSLYPNSDKCVSTPDNAAVFPPLDKRVTSPSSNMLSSNGIFSTMDSPGTTGSKRVSSTSSRSLLRSSQNSGMLPPLDKTAASRSPLPDSVGSSTNPYPIDKQVSSTTPSRNLNNVQAVSSTSDLFSPLDKRVSASTEDLIKSLENLSAEIPAPSSASLQDFSLFSQHFSRGS